MNRVTLPSRPAQIPRVTPVTKMKMVVHRGFEGTGRTGPAMAFGVTCGRCGHEADIDRFTATPSGPLPRDTYRCPGCGHAWKRVPVGVRMVGTMAVPERIEIREVYDAV